MVVKQLSSQVGDQTQYANRVVVSQCLDNPTLLDEVAEALSGNNVKLLGDCCEVMTKVAESKPELVTPYVDLLVPLLSHKTTRVRWETMHTLALAAELIPDKLKALVPRLIEIIEKDSSTIVRDYAVDALGNMAKADEDAARTAYPALKKALYVWEGKHLGRALTGLCSVVISMPLVAAETLQLANEYAEHGKPVVRKAAKALIKASKS